MSKNEVYCAISFLERVFCLSVFFFAPVLVKSYLNEVFSHCYLSFCLCLSLCLPVSTFVLLARFKRSSLQNFSVNGHFAHYKPTKKRLRKPKNQKLFAVAVLGFQLQLELQLQRCQKSLFSSFWSFYACARLECERFSFHKILSTLCQSDSLKIKLKIPKWY